MPRLLPESEILAANGLEGTLRPLAQQAAGPLLGGIVVALFEPGLAILAASVTYLVSAGCLAAMRVSSAPDRAGMGHPTAFTDLREAARYVRQTSWLWATDVIWGTLLQRRVPDGLRGRVSSLDFFVSLSLMPASMALAGPAGDAFGLTAVFVAAALVPALAAPIAFRAGRLGRDELAHPLS